MVFTYYVGDLKKFTLADSLAGSRKKLQQDNRGGRGRNEVENRL